MKILFAAAEVVPFYKTGGLADVARALPDALCAAGHDVRIVMPAYTLLADRLAGVHGEPLHVPWRGGNVEARVLHSERHDSAPTSFIAASHVFDTLNPYDEDPRDALALGRRFAFFSAAVAALARDWEPDVVHLNDWQTGLVPLYAGMAGVDVATVFAIHNLAYQGNFTPALMREVGIPASFWRQENGVEFHGSFSFMKAGLALADRLVTVSPSYAAEIRTPAYGNGLDGLLRHRRRALHGILNGIDTHHWNPATDRLLPATYNVRTLKRKDETRRALCERAGVAGDGAVLGIVSRLAGQKGIDILLGALPELIERGCSLVVLGSGEHRFESALHAATAHWPDRVAFARGFNEPLAHLIYAGADFFLMPSLYEPCGLGQMIAQRYGTPPIARRTGGLNDTVRDGDTGFLFDDPAPHAFLSAVDRAISARTRRGWRRIQGHCMTEDHSWGRSAGAYERLYTLAMGSDVPL